MSGDDQKSPEYAQDEKDADRLRRTTTPDAMSVELVSAFAGDRDLTEVERATIKAQQVNRGSVFFSDLLYAISHHYFAPELAESLWDDILVHKHVMSERLGRNVRIAVATLDYLSNITNEFIAPTLISEAYISELANLSMRDGMTGLFNHSSCYELLELEFQNHRRYGIGLSVLLLDIDNFKLVNDRHGHQRGDRILVELAKVLIEQTRDSDICCRFGGDEFVVILRLTNAPEVACEIAERIRTRAAKMTCGGSQIAVSVGVALCNHKATSPHALLESADQALYRAKTRGKNQVCIT